MPAYHTVFAQFQFVLVCFVGEVSLSEIEADRQALLQNPEFQPSFAQMIDLTQARTSETSPEDIRSLASFSVFSPGVKRAIVAPRNAEFGLSRMYELYADRLNQDTQVFRTVDEACTWLGIPCSLIAAGNPWLGDG